MKQLGTFTCRCFTEYALYAGTPEPCEVCGDQWLVDIGSQLGMKRIEDILKAYTPKQFTFAEGLMEVSYETDE